MSDFNSDSETELLVLSDRGNRRINYDSADPADYNFGFRNNRRNRHNSSFRLPSMGSILRNIFTCCG